MIFTTAKRRRTTASANDCRTTQPQNVISACVPVCLWTGSKLLYRRTRFGLAEHNGISACTAQRAIETWARTKPRTEVLAATRNNNIQQEATRNNNSNLHASAKWKYAPGVGGRNWMGEGGREGPGCTLDLAADTKLGPGTAYKGVSFRVLAAPPD